MCFFWICIIPGGVFSSSVFHLAFDGNHHGIETTNKQPYHHLALLRREEELVLEEFLPDHSAWEFQLKD